MHHRNRLKALRLSLACRYLMHRMQNFGIVRTGNQNLLKPKVLKGGMTMATTRFRYEDDFTLEQ